MRPLSRDFLAISLLLSCAFPVWVEPGFARWPAERRGTIVFTAEGDLWTVPRAGGRATRLTSHPAEETQAAISPDGSTVAFVASYDGGPDVYVMPLAGGEPRRLTFDSGRVWIAGFDPSGSVVYATENVVGPSARRVVRVVDPRDGQTRELPLADAYELSFEPDAETAWFTRFGLQVTGDNARGYRGGAMAELWRWSTRGAAEAVRVAADLNANVSRPMPWKGRLYVVRGQRSGRRGEPVVDAPRRHGSEAGHPTS